MGVFGKVWPGVVGNDYNLFKKNCQYYGQAFLNQVEEETESVRFERLLDILKNNNAAWGDFNQF